jgi:hypothetical protein
VRQVDTSAALRLHKGSPWRLRSSTLFKHAWGGMEYIATMVRGQIAILRMTDDLTTYITYQGLGHLLSAVRRHDQDAAKLGPDPDVASRHDSGRPGARTKKKTVVLGF